LLLPTVIPLTVRGLDNYGKENPPPFLRFGTAALLKRTPLNKDGRHLCRPDGVTELGAWNFYSLFLPDFFAAAQRAFIAAAIRLRAAGDIPRRFRPVVEVDRFVLPGGRPRRLPEPPSLIPSKACIAASSLSRSARNCRIISLAFIRPSYQSPLADLSLSHTGFVCRNR